MPKSTESEAPPAAPAPSSSESSTAAAASAAFDLNLVMLVDLFVASRVALFKLVVVKLVIHHLVVHPVILIHVSILHVSILDGVVLVLVVAAADGVPLRVKASFVSSSPNAPPSWSATQPARGRTYLRDLGGAGGAARASPRGPPRAARVPPP